MSCKDVDLVVVVMEAVIYAVLVAVSLILSTLTLISPEVTVGCFNWRSLHIELDSKCMEQLWSNVILIDWT